MPPSIDVLVEQRFLRKEFKDPMTGEKFLVLPGVVPTSGVQTQIQSAQTAIGRAREETQARLNAAAGRGRGSTPSPTGAVEQPAFGTVQGGIAGVVSKSQDESLLIYNGRTRYNEWEFRYTPVAAAPGQGGDAAGAAGARGGVGAGARGQDPGRGARRGGPGSSTIDNTGGRGMQQGGRGFRLQPDGRGGVQMTPLDPTGNPGATPPPAGQTPRGGAAAPQAPGGVYRR
jgi:hypothetical protein